MTKTIHKMFFAWDFDKEESWLNEMSAKGLHLQSVGFCTYTFNEGIPGDYVYRLEMLDNLASHAESSQYIRFIEDTGAEHIGSLFRWVYFRKKTNGGGFDIYSDLASRIMHLKRIVALLGILSCVNILNGINMLRVWRINNLISPLYLSIICLACGLLLGYGFLKIYRKKQMLEKEKALRE
ncbi:MAG: DUF2812 domain-containing protein [Oscillospiraceae bacterium]|nr:DUF2812 domain-containing protein [Oscillospiraceae bacterium]